MPAEDNKSRRRFQLRLSTIMLLVAIAAIAMGWWTDHALLMERLRFRDAEIRVFVLRNSKAGEVAVSLQRLFPDGKSDPIRIASDDRTNGLIVSASTERLDAVEAALVHLDAEIDRPNPREQSDARGTSAASVVNGKSTPRSP